jgi:hypothetical protein
MIILMSSDLVNLEAAKLLKASVIGESICTFPDINLRENKDKEITLIDLNADGAFQALWTPEILATQLISHGLNNRVQTINLLISDMDINRSMFTFAQYFCNSLQQQGISVQVQIVADLSYITFINPPTSEDKKWQIYSILVADFIKDLGDKKFEVERVNKINREPQTNALSHDLLMNYPKKELLWQGEKILEWLFANNERVIIPKNPQDYTFAEHRNV